MPMHRMESVPHPVSGLCSERCPKMTVSAFFPTAFRCTAFVMNTRFVIGCVNGSTFIPSSYTPGLTYTVSPATKAALSSAAWMVRNGRASVPRPSTGVSAALGSSFATYHGPAASAAVAANATITASMFFLFIACFSIRC